MSTTDRLASEQAFHDLQAQGRAAHLLHPEDLRFADDDYLGHETWVRPALERLGPLTGLRVLDYGCGQAVGTAWPRWCWRGAARR
jgi:hypothetical protein